MKIIEKIKKAYQNYIKKLSKINKEEFGDSKKGLECCDINKK